MAELFRPYEGNKPYFFVSYSHRDSAFMLDVISPMREKHFRLWYDEGIPAGSDWPANIADHMAGCSAVLFFQSADSLASPNCFNEIKNAHEQGKKLYCVRLDGSDPKEEWPNLLADGLYHTPDRPTAAALSAAFLARDEVIRNFGGTEEDYRASGKKGEKIPLLYSLLAAAAALSLLLGAGVYAKRNLLSKTLPAAPAPTVVATLQPAIDLDVYGSMWQQYMDFPDDQQKKAVQNTLGIYKDSIESERLADITALYFCGSLSAKDGLSDAEYTGGGWTVNSAPVKEGAIRDLSLIAQMPYLEELALIWQPLEDLSSLNNLPRLRELSLAGCNNIRLETLAALPALEALRLEHSNIYDLTLLKDTPFLKTVTVSADMFPMKLDPDAEYDVVLVK